MTLFQTWSSYNILSQFYLCPAHKTLKQVPVQYSPLFLHSTEFPINCCFFSLHFTHTLKRSASPHNSHVTGVLRSRRRRERWRGSGWWEATGAKVCHTLLYTPGSLLLLLLPLPLSLFLPLPLPFVYPASLSPSVNITTGTQTPVSAVYFFIREAGREGGPFQLLNGEGSLFNFKD